MGGNSRTGIVLKTGDLIKFTHLAEASQNDIGVIVDVDNEGNVSIFWAKSPGIQHSTVERLKNFDKTFELIT